MVDNKTLSSISYRIEDAKSTGGSRTAPTRFDITTFLRLPITILSSESFIPRAYGSGGLDLFCFSVFLRTPWKTANISSPEQKRHRFTYLNIYQISYYLVKKNIPMRWFCAVITIYDVSARLNLVNFTNPGPEASIGQLYHRVFSGIAEKFQVLQKGGSILAFLPPDWPSRPDRPAYRRAIHAIES